MKVESVVDSLDFSRGSSPDSGNRRQRACI